MTLRVLFAGTPEVAVPSLDAILASNHEVVAVLTRPDAPSGRGRALAPSPVRVAAEAHGIPVLTPTTLRDNDFGDQLRALHVDVCPVVAYGQLVPADLLGVPRLGWVNLHFSLLPAWRGAAPVQRALMAGDPVTGASTFLIEAGLDTGPVFGVMTETVRPSDTAGSLLTRLATAGAPLLVATLDALDDGSADPALQDPVAATYAAKIEVAEAEVPWDRAAHVVDRLIRACTPAPGAWTTFRGERLKIGPVSLATETPQAMPGEIVAGKRDVWIGTGTEAVCLGEVTPLGKRPMPAADWARGVRPQAGERLGRA